MEIAAIRVPYKARAIHERWLDLHVGLQILVPRTGSRNPQGRNALKDDEGVVLHVAVIEVSPFLPVCPPVPVVLVFPHRRCVQGERQQQSEKRQQHPFHPHPSFCVSVDID